jgi:hypothetical protein
LGLTNLSTKRQRIAELARAKSGVALSTLHHVLDLEWMREAYRLTRKDGAPGIDGVTAAEYAQNLETNLSDLLERIKLEASASRFRELAKGACMRDQRLEDISWHNRR